MKNILTVEISEGLGNQLFMYSHAYALSKKLNYELLIDNTSGYSKNKNKLRKHQMFMLDKFNINNSYATPDLKFDTTIKYLFKKVFIFFDNFKSKKYFIIEKIKKNNNKKEAETFINIDKTKISSSIYVQGNFENYKYFESLRNNLVEILAVKNEHVDLNNPIIDKLKKTNSVSIHIRKNRYSDQKKLSINNQFNERSKIFTNQIIEYVNKSIDYFKNNLSNPTFFIWSNDFTNFDEILNKLKITNYELVNTNDAIRDFDLFKYSKNFIVGPSSFHWWGAWLNENPNKICLRPANINPSNNNNFWPDNWIKI